MIMITSPCLFRNCCKGLLLSIEHCSTWALPKQYLLFIAARLILLLGAVWPSAPRTRDGTIRGATARTAVVAEARRKNWRRLRAELRSGFDEFMSVFEWRRIMAVKIHSGGGYDWEEMAF